MSEQTEPKTSAGEQPVPQAVGLAPAPKKSTPINVDETRDEFIKNAQPVADAMRKRGKIVEATQLEQAAKVIGVAVGTQPQQQPDALKGESVSNVLKNIWDVIEKDPELKKMPQAQNLRKAGQALDGAGLLNITIRNGVVVSFVSNFAENFSMAQKAGAKPVEKRDPSIVLESAASAARAQQPAPAAQPAAAVQAPAEKPAAVVQQVTVAQQSSQADKPAPAPALQFTQYAPTPDTGVIEKRKAVASPMDALNVGITADGRFGVNPQVNQARLIGDGMKSLEKFFDYQMPTGGLKIAKVGLAEPGQMKQTADGWEVVKKGQLELTDTAGNVHRPSQHPSAPAQQVAPATGTPAATKPVLDLTPTPAVQEKVASLLSPALKAQAQALAEQSLRNRAQPKRFVREDIPFDLLAKMGVQAAELEKTGQLQKLLDGKKTDLIPSFSIRNQEGEPVSFPAKLVMTRDTQGVASLHFDLPKHQLQIPKQIQGQEITPVMKEQLEKGGVVLTKGANGQAAYLAVDKEMNKVVAVPSKGLEIPKILHGVALQPEQRKELQEGRPVRIENMVHQNRSFDAVMQLDPIKRTILTQQPKFHETPKQVIKATPKEEVAAPRPRMRM
ncbi:DUF4099 domain-containing protein [Hymenobacter norwichensis]|uniref:DUF4099 domain-containing protein n=1 Tax=Hymenobacter norwichensis TaxID=223903 RepID=UPI0003B4AA3D|nr:DUF4099 domain-containing protein [Hymenobacter norwichensis]